MAKGDRAKKGRGKRSRYRVDIFRAWCKRCGICVAFCPYHVLEKDEMGYPLAVNPDACEGCLWCELRCPDFAITVIEEEQGAGEAPSGQ